MKNYEHLTQREQEVKELVIQGFTNEQIAKRLFISIHTARAHVCNIIGKLCVNNRTEIAVLEIKKLQQELKSLKSDTSTKREGK